MGSARPSPIEVLSQGKVAVYEEPTGPAGVRIRKRPTTEPKQGHVAVAIKAASLNHLDLWLAHGAQRVPPPRVIAADGAGVVQASSDPRWKPGDEVVIFPTLCCWECERCRAGDNVYCERFGVIGEHTDGTACELFHLDARSVFPKPKALSWHEAAAFPLTFLTAWRMLTTRANLQPDETVLVIGAGAGVAVAAIQIARHFGARVLATSRSEAKRKRAQELGADAGDRRRRRRRVRARRSRDDGGIDALARARRPHRHVRLHVRSEGGDWHASPFLPARLAAGIDDGQCERVRGRAQGHRPRHAAGGRQRLSAVRGAGGFDAS